MVLLKDILKTILEGIEYKDTIIEIYLEAYKECSKLSGKTILTREFKGLEKPAAKITAEKNKIYGTKNALGLMDEPIIEDLFYLIKDEYGLSNFIYCSHGESKFGLSGTSYIVVPGNPFKAIWNDDVKDIYANASRMLKNKGNLDEFPIATYYDSNDEGKWPSGDVSEVILSCDYYFLIREGADLIKESKRHTGIDSIQTYDQLATVLKDVFTRPDMRGLTYINKYSNYSWPDELNTEN